MSPTIDARMLALVERLRDGQKRLQKTIVLREDAAELFSDAADALEFTFAAKGHVAFGLLDIRDALRELADANRVLEADTECTDAVHERFHDALDRLQTVADALFPAADAKAKKR